MPGDHRNMIRYRCTTCRTVAESVAAHQAGVAATLTPGAGRYEQFGSRNTQITTDERVRPWSNDIGTFPVQSQQTETKVYNDSHKSQPAKPDQERFTTFFDDNTGEFKGMFPTSSLSHTPTANGDDVTIFSRDGNSQVLVGYR